MRLGSRRRACLGTPLDRRTTASSPSSASRLASSWWPPWICRHVFVQGVCHTQAARGGAAPRGPISGCRNDRDAIAAERADPELVANLDQSRAGAELRRVGLADDF